VLGVRRWTELVTDRKKWNDIARQAKAHRGAVAPMEEEEEEEGRRRRNKSTQS